MVRPGTQSGRPGTMEQALKTPRTARTARPITSQSARSVRLGTASMVADPGGSFIQMSRINLSKYATLHTISKPLFQYIFYHENDVRHVSKLLMFIQHQFAHLLFEALKKHTDLVSREDI